MEGMTKDYVNQMYYTGAWYNSSWYKTLCTVWAVDDFGNLVKAS